jgi:hypothetical protein
VSAFHFLMFGDLFDEMMVHTIYGVLGITYCYGLSTLALLPPLIGVRANSPIHVSGEHQVILRFIILIQIPINTVVYMILPLIIVINTSTLLSSSSSSPSSLSSFHLAAGLYRRFERADLMWFVKCVMQASPSCWSAHVLEVGER